jgi:hypothetical protein
MLSAIREQPGIHAFSTHDSLVTATVAHLLEVPLGPEAWPYYLEAAFFWEEDGVVWTAYRDHHRAKPGPVVSLCEEDVVHLACREVAATVGLTCQARFFVAGGLFKTLLTGRAPRDVDLWAPTARDRENLVACLMERGAEPLPQQPYTQGFRIGGRLVEVPLSVGPESLEERLARFDLALSAVGAESSPGDHWRGVVHPLALRSVEQQQVLLLDELPNWRHSLTSLERMRRYASELGFESPESEEGRIWSIFDGQPPEKQRGMVRRFEISARRDQGVEDDLRRRWNRHAG